VNHRRPERPKEWVCLLLWDLGRSGSAPSAGPSGAQPIGDRPPGLPAPLPKYWPIRAGRLSFQRFPHKTPAFGNSPKNKTAAPQGIVHTPVGENGPLPLRLEKDSSRTMTLTTPQRTPCPHTSLAPPDATPHSPQYQGLISIVTAPSSNHAGALPRWCQALAPLNSTFPRNASTPSPGPPRHHREHPRRRAGVTCDPVAVSRHKEDILRSESERPGAHSQRPVPSPGARRAAQLAIAMRAAKARCAPRWPSSMSRNSSTPSWAWRRLPRHRPRNCF